MKTLTWLISILMVLLFANLAAANEPAREGDALNAETQLKAGQSLLKKGMLEGALAEFEDSYESERKPRLLCQMGLIQIKLRRNPAACESFRRCLDTDASLSETARLSDVNQVMLEKIRDFMTKNCNNGPPPSSSKQMEITQTTPPAPPPSAAPPAQQSVMATAREGSGRAPRPRWRLATGSLGIAAGIALFGYGLGGLLKNGTCVDAAALPGAQCLAVYDSAKTGGASVGIGTGLIVVGISLVSWPGKK